MAKKLTAEGQIKELAARLAAETEAKLRLAAEVVNLQNRHLAQVTELGKRALAAVLTDLLPVFDHLLLAIKHQPSAKSADPALQKFLDGISQIDKQLEQKLVGLGLQRIKTAGEPFNHDHHEAISYESSDSVPAETVIDEVESGWLLDEQVLKPAKVRVSSGQ
ncbi:MAG: nucleotide exchange factor GrpE [Patescibacteria group bacterium]